MSSEKPALEARGLLRTFGSGETLATAVQDVSLSIYSGEISLLMGPSGSGKSTLLALLSGLLRPDAGEVHCLGKDLGPMSEKELQEFRLQNFGYIFQGYNLFPALTALQQLEIVLRWGEGMGGREARKRSESMLSTLGLSKKLHLRPAQMSGGEKQRVAIGRASSKSRCFVSPTSPLAPSIGRMANRSLSYCGPPPVIEALQSWWSRTIRVSSPWWTEFITWRTAACSNRSRHTIINCGAFHEQGKPTLGNLVLGDCRAGDHRGWSSLGSALACRRRPVRDARSSHPRDEQTDHPIRWCGLPWPSRRGRLGSRAQPFDTRANCRAPSQGRSARQRGNWFSFASTTARRNTSSSWRKPASKRRVPISKMPKKRPELQQILIAQQQKKIEAMAQARGIAESKVTRAEELAKGNIAAPEELVGATTRDESC